MKVVWTVYALHTLEQVQEYVEANYPSAATRIIRQVKRATQKLEVFPNIGRNGIRSGTRELVVRDLPYVIVYRVTDVYVQVLRVFHDKQLRK
jgi:toxin ParE1/3/4